jgi:hypothetical protein
VALGLGQVRPQQTGLHHLVALVVLVFLALVTRLFLTVHPTQQLIRSRFPLVRFARQSLLLALHRVMSLSQDRRLGLFMVVSLYQVQALLGLILAH